MELRQNGKGHRMQRTAWTRCVVLLSLIVVLSGGFAQAGVMVGDQIRFFRAEGNATSGGEYGVAYASDPGHELFRTFSLNQDLFLDFNAHGFVIDSITTFARPDHNELDSRTAYLYSKFSAGTLSDYNYLPNGMGHKQSADSLQLAIWNLEGGSSGVDAQAQAWIDEANAAIAGGQWSGLGNVRILNLSWATGRRHHDAGDPAQDVLAIIPEPSTLAIWTVLGMSGLCVLYRRRALHAKR
jgi:hypothetical protein